MVEQTRMGELKEHIGLVTDEDLGEVAAMCLQELAGRGYSVSALYVTPHGQLAPGIEPPEPEFVVSITKTFRADASE